MSVFTSATSAAVQICGCYHTLNPLFVLLNDIVLYPRLVTKASGGGAQFKMRSYRELGDDAILSCSHGRCIYLFLFTNSWCSMACHSLMWMQGSFKPLSVKTPPTYSRILCVQVMKKQSMTSYVQVSTLT